MAGEEGQRRRRCRQRPRCRAACGISMQTARTLRCARGADNPPTWDCCEELSVGSTRWGSLSSCLCLRSGASTKEPSFSRAVHTAVTWGRRTAVIYYPWAPATQNASWPKPSAQGGGHSWAKISSSVFVSFCPHHGCVHQQAHRPLSGHFLAGSQDAGPPDLRCFLSRSGLPGTGHPPGRGASSRRG